MSIPANPQEYRQQLLAQRKLLKDELSSVLISRDANVVEQYNYLSARINKVDRQLADLASEVAA